MTKPIEDRIESAIRLRSFAETSLANDAHASKLFSGIVKKLENKKWNKLSGEEKRFMEQNSSALEKARITYVQRVAGSDGKVSASELLSDIGSDKKYENLARQLGRLNPERAVVILDDQLKEGTPVICIVHRLSAETLARK